jgi:hypothetical protein
VVKYREELSELEKEIKDLEISMSLEAIKTFEENSIPYRICESMQDYNRAFDQDEKIIPVNEHGHIQTLEPLKNFISPYKKLEYKRLCREYNQS